MAQRPTANDQRSLSTMFAQIENQPASVATRALLRAEFLFINSPERPFHALGMNVSELDVLAAIARAEGATLKCCEIAAATLITKGGITGIIDRLAARGLVQRTPARDDRRSILIQLTEKGVEFCRDFFPKLKRANQEAFERALTPAQVRQLGKLLTLLVGSWEADIRSTPTGVSEQTNGHERI